MIVYPLVLNSNVQGGLMELKKIVTGCFFIFALIGVAPGARAQDVGNYPAVTGYSTESTTTSSMPGGQTMVSHAKEYYTKEKYRFESSVDGVGITSSGFSIVRLDKNVLWTFMPEHNMYTESPASSTMAHPWPQDISKAKIIGTETIDGQLTDKYDDSNEKCNSSTTFLSHSSGLPVKVEIHCGGDVVVEYKNTQIGDQPDSLFEMPAGYKKMSF